MGRAPGRLRPLASAGGGVRGAGAHAAASTGTIPDLAAKAGASTPK
jgi:hypothetical protein